MHDCSSAIQSVHVYFTGLQSDVLNGLEVRFTPPLSTSTEVGMSTFFVCMTREWHKLWLVGNVLLWLMTYHQRSLSRALRNVSLRIDTLLILFCLMCGQWVYNTATSVQHTASLGKHIFNDNYCPSVLQQTVAPQHTLAIVSQFIETNKCIISLLWAAVALSVEGLHRLPPQLPLVTFSKVLNPQTLTWGPIQG